MFCMVFFSFKKIDDRKQLYQENHCGFKAARRKRGLHYHRDGFRTGRRGEN